MKVSILYTRNTPADRDIEYLTRHLQNLRIPVALIDADSREGTALSELHDVFERPAVLVVSDTGTLIERWQGAALPRAEEVSAAYGVHQ
jgi:hypothetical protein